MLLLHHPAPRGPGFFCPPGTCPVVGRIAEMTAKELLLLRIPKEIFPGNFAEWALTLLGRDEI
jgi:hypothetical protein